MLIAPQIAALDNTLRSRSLRCTRCGRPESGVLYRKETRAEADLVDRDFCASFTCPMRETHDESIIVTVEADRP